MSIKSNKFLLNFASLGYKVGTKHVLYFDQHKDRIPNSIEIDKATILKLQYYINEVYNKVRFGRSLRKDTRKELEQNIFSHNGLTEISEGITKSDFFDKYYLKDPAFTYFIALAQDAYKKEHCFHIFEDPYARFNTTDKPYVKKSLYPQSDLEYKRSKKAASYDDVKNLLEFAYKRALLDVKLLYGKYTGNLNFMKDQLLKNSDLIDSIHPKKSVYKLLNSEMLFNESAKQVYLREVVGSAHTDRFDKLIDHYGLDDLDLADIKGDGKISYDLHYINYLNAVSDDPKFQNLMDELNFETLQHENDIDYWLLPGDSKGYYLTKEAIESQFQRGVIGEKYYKKKIEAWEKGNRGKTYENTLQEYRESIKSSDTNLPSVNSFQEFVRLEGAKEGLNINWETNTEAINAKNELINNILNDSIKETDFDSRRGSRYRRRIKNEAFTSYYSLYFKEEPYNQLLDNYEKCLKVLECVTHKSHDNRHLYTLAILTKNDQVADQFFKVIDIHSNSCFAIEYFIQFNKVFNYDLKPKNFITKYNFDNITNSQYQKCLAFIESNSYKIDDDVKNFQKLLNDLYNNEISPESKQRIKSYLHDTDSNFLPTHGNKFDGQHGLKIISIDDSLRKLINENVPSGIKTSKGQNNDSTSYTFKSFSRDFRKYIYSHAKEIQNKIIKLLTKDSGIKYFEIRWKSELNLYEIVNEEFSNIDVLMHHSPSWLSPQHLDIYIPKHNIAIEYNGKQHYEPIEIFGGEEAYKQTVKRDKKKAKLCQLNDTNLIIHKYDDSIDQTLESIRDLI